MATTTNYGWTTPDNTAYVKDGASAIRTLGSSIDTTLNSVTNGKNVGLSLLNTTNFSGAVSTSITNVFSSAYKNYRIVVNSNVATTRQFLYLQMTGTNTDYYWGVAGWRSNGTAYNANSNNTLPGFIATFADLDNRNLSCLDIGNPQVATLTTISGTFSGGDSTSALGGTINGFLNNNTQYTGFTLVASNNISGTVSVYGYRG
jgi:hypothetical protein